MKKNIRRIMGLAAVVFSLTACSQGTGAEPAGTQIEETSAETFPEETIGEEDSASDVAETTILPKEEEPDASDGGPGVSPKREDASEESGTETPSETAEDGLTKRELSAADFHAENTESGAGTGSSAAGETKAEEARGREDETEPDAAEGQEEAETAGTEERWLTHWQDNYDYRIILATDIHYLAEELADRGSAFEKMVEYGDGKVVTYIEEITDAFLSEVLERDPDVLILSGDLTLEGEKKSHEELAKKLYQIEDAGIPVLVIPGNHDINNRKAAKYKGTQRMPAEYTTPEEFEEIYEDFGYNEAAARDPNSLSYVYKMNEETWFLMIDSCKYRPTAKVGGSIGNETYYWIERQLESAWAENAVVVPVAHHNLLDESKVYVDDCTIEHGDQLADLFNGWDVSFFLSGHLHVQHYMRSDDNKGIWEIVTSSLATPTCKYGIIDFCHNGDFSYHTKSLDMEDWAERTMEGREDLLKFNTFQEPFLKRVFYNQSYTELSEISSLTEEQRVRMSDVYSELNYEYYQGTAYRIRDQILANPDYELWKEDGTQTILAEYVRAIIEDATKDYNSISDD